MARPIISCLALSFLAAFALTGSLPWALAQSGVSVFGVVVSQSGQPLSGALVRVRATDNLTYTTSDGRFSLSGLTSGAATEITAWASGGYYIGSQVITPPVSSSITITLRPHHTEDNAAYGWLDPSPNSGVALQCGNCHPQILPQWRANAHGQAVSNSRFFSLYNGTDLAGTTLVAPGFKLDFPNVAGNCANCHAPGAAANAPFTCNMTTVRGSVAAGIHCDFCHKVGGVYLNPATRAPYNNVPGVLSLRLLRPPAGEQIFFGPYDDIKDPDTLAPDMTQSGYCAPCHSFAFWGTKIYQSYNEWLASPYAAEGIQCQACHMPPNGDNYFALPEIGSPWHPADRIPSHLDLGLKDLAFMRSTVAMTLSARASRTRAQVTVTLENVGAGHHVPTDSPLRHMILVVSASDGNGEELPLRSGPRVPEWGGGYAGMPGRCYAKILQDVSSGSALVVSYWKPTRIVSDNRIPARGKDTTTYTFAMSETEANITAVLIFRRAFQSLERSKGWEPSDIVLAEADVTLTASRRIVSASYVPQIKSQDRARSWKRP
jgi:hypothetical protein